MKGSLGSLENPSLFGYVTGLRNGGNLGFQRRTKDLAPGVQSVELEQGFLDSPLVGRALTCEGMEDAGRIAPVQISLDCLTIAGNEARKLAGHALPQQSELAQFALQ